MDILMSRVPNIEKNKRGTYMSISNSFKVKFIRDDSYGFQKNHIYDAIECKSRLGQTQMISVIDRFGDEYAYPAAWFERCYF
jgi:hypothetical protein